MQSHFSCLQLFVTLRTVACQVALSMGFSRQEYWSGLSCPSLGDLTNPGIKPVPPASLELQADSLPLSHPGSPPMCLVGFILIERSVRSQNTWANLFLSPSDIPTAWGPPWNNKKSLWGEGDGGPAQADRALSGAWMWMCPNAYTQAAYTRKLFSFYSEGQRSPWPWIRCSNIIQMLCTFFHFQKLFFYRCFRLSDKQSSFSNLGIGFN